MKYICIEEVEGALKVRGGDGPGGEVLKVWLNKIFNRSIALEEVPVCVKEGIILLLYKERVQNLFR